MPCLIEVIFKISSGGRGPDCLAENLTVKMRPVRIPYRVRYQKWRRRPQVNIAKSSRAPRGRPLHNTAVSVDASGHLELSLLARQ
ncbi:hypothetical protein EVAR_93083_1 [Eumeta japonica]|uniref:Uncharacterized protein n=1 Tax=Eumeta variegata TaxID=151549 RepID=A0A4C1TG80_EUMVA|nr:hypothetical protein EVAR_93083_1 [Eumeta japonica]